MIDSIINGLFSITYFWNRTQDPVLAEYRGYMRNIIVFTFVTILLFIVAAVISPSDEPVKGFEIMFNQLKYYAETGLSIVSLCFGLASLWNCLQLYLFIRKYGIYD